MQVPLSIIRRFPLYTQQWYVSKPICRHIPYLCVQWKTPDDGQWRIRDDGQRNCPKHVEFCSKNKFEKLVHLVGGFFNNIFVPRKLSILLSRNTCCSSLQLYITRVTIIRQKPRNMTLTSHRTIFHVYDVSVTVQCRWQKHMTLIHGVVNDSQRKSHETVDCMANGRNVDLKYTCAAFILGYVFCQPIFYF